MLPGGWKVVGVFAIVGPLVGAAIVLTIALTSMVIGAGEGGLTGPDILPAFGTMALVVLTGGLVVGSVPAALTGLICVLASRRMKGDRQWLVQGASVGLGVTFFLMLVVQIFIGRVGHSLPGEPDATLPGLLFGSLAFALIGAAAGLASAAATRGMRPKNGV